MPRLVQVLPAVAAGLLLASGLGTAHAHAPNIASYELDTSSERSWELHVHMPTAGMHAVMKELHPDERLSSIPLERYEQYVVDALLAGIALDSDAGELVLGEAEPALGPHESAVTFVVELPRSRPAEVHAHIDAMSEHPHQHNVFRVRDASVSEHIVLDEDNGYRGALSVPGASTPAGVGIAIAIAAGAIRSLRPLGSTLGTLRM